jgi:hypothetical protein
MDLNRIRVYLKRALLSLVAVAVLVYAADYIYFRVRMIHPQAADPLETFTAPRLYAIGEKGGKVDYEIDAQNPEQTFVCAHSWFPHAGHSPCWYLKKKSQEPIPM